MFLSGARGVIQHYAASEQMPAKSGAAPPDPPTSNRAALRLGITGEGDALRIFVSDSPEGEGPNANWTSFLFLNTHSLPETEDDNTAPEYSNVNLGDVSNGRLLDTSTDKLTISFEFFDQRGYDYGNSPSTEDVLQSLSPTVTRTVEPLQSLGDWNAPFFYGDGRHVFYVTPTNTPITVTDPGAGSFGPTDIAHLVDGVVQRNDIGLVIHRPGGDPSPMMRVTEDANINHFAPGTRTVRHVAPNIGIAGSSIAQSLNGLG